MGAHIAQRLIVSIPVVFGVLTLGFLLLQVIPTDPAVVLAGPTATMDVIQAIRADLGLDRPLWVQFGLYLARVVQGDLGRSLISNTTVVAELGQAIGPTVELMIACLAWAVPTGIAMGTVAAVRRGALVDRLVMAVSVAGVSMPIFFVALVLIQVVGLDWGLLPFIGRNGPIWSLAGLESLALPALTLGGVFVGPVARMTRASVLEVLSADHVRTARAKGLGERRVVLAHALRNALIPVVTLVGLQAGVLMGGAVITETIFAWPGVGRLAVGAILANDFPLAQGTIIVLSLGFIVINLLVDLLYGMLDPRVAHR
jgi:ABC-type dipeptide/oligopeptide/nickel transport system permease component